MSFRLIIIMTLILLPMSLLSVDKVIVCRGDAEDFKTVSAVIKEELGKDYNVLDFKVTRKTSYTDFAARIRKEQPKLVVLLDNPSVELMKKFNMEKDDYAKNLKSIAAMGLSLKKVLKGNKNICGISYEVPAYDFITHYKYITNVELQEVLVIYRGSEHKNMIASAKENLAKEGIVLRALDAEVRGKDNRRVQFFLKKNLLREGFSKKVSAIWVLADNVLLNTQNMKFWEDAVKKIKKPFIGGIRHFALSAGFCTYSASPNHKDLGAQIAEMIFAVNEDGEKPEDINVESIISVDKTVNLKRLQKCKLTLKKEVLTDEELVK